MRLGAVVSREFGRDTLSVEGHETQSETSRAVPAISQ